MWKKWFQRQDQEDLAERAALREERELLYREIAEAKHDWDNAMRHFEYAEGKDQIDYAIFAIEAAEKRYEMLLRKAKALGGSLPWPVRSAAV